MTSPNTADLDELMSRVVACRRCPRLVAWREQVAREKRAAYKDQEYWGRPVPGFGDPLARLIVVGLAPAAHGANRTGRMFTGDRSGDWLYRALYRAGFANQPTSISAGDGLRLVDAWVTSPVKCAPPANKPTPDEQRACATWFDAELELLDRARVYVVLGHLAYRSLWSAMGRLGLALPRPRSAFGHGAQMVLPGGRAILCSFHPSQQNTFTGRLTEQMFDGVFDRAAQLLAQPDRSGG